MVNLLSYYNLPVILEVSFCKFLCVGYFVCMYIYGCNDLRGIRFPWNEATNGCEPQ